MQTKNCVPFGVRNKSNSAYNHSKQNFEKPTSKQSNIQKPKVKFLFIHLLMNVLLQKEIDNFNNSKFNCFINLKLRAKSGMRRPQKVHRLLKQRHSHNAKRVFLSHSWVRRFCYGIIKKCLEQTTKMDKTNNIVRNSETSDQQLSVSHKN